MAKTAEKVTRTARIHIYKVEVDGEVKLVRTTSRARAVRHVLNRNITASIPTQDELYDYAKQGIEVEDVE